MCQVHFRWIGLWYAIIIALAFSTKLWFSRSCLSILLHIRSPRTEWSTQEQVKRQVCSSWAWILLCCRVGPGSRFRLGLQPAGPRKRCRCDASTASYRKFVCCACLGTGHFVILTRCSMWRLQRIVRRNKILCWLQIGCPTFSFRSTLCNSCDHLGTERIFLAQLVSTEVQMNLLLVQLPLTSHMLLCILCWIRDDNIDNTFSYGLYSQFLQLIWFLRFLVGRACQIWPMVEQSTNLQAEFGLLIHY